MDTSSLKPLIHARQQRWESPESDRRRVPAPSEPRSAAPPAAKHPSSTSKSGRRTPTGSNPSECCGQNSSPSEFLEHCRSLIIPCCCSNWSTGSWYTLWMTEQYPDATSNATILISQGREIPAELTVRAILNPNRFHSEFVGNATSPEVRMSLAGFGWEPPKTYR